MIWWIVIFTVLPWKVKRQDHYEQGHDRGAPDKTYLYQKILITSFISLLIWFVVRHLINSRLIDFDC